MAWTTTWTSIIWTSGDVATESKMDGMVANDIAYDSHSGEGLLLDNNVAFSAEDTGAARRKLIKLDASDDIQVGEDNVVGHATINAGTSKLVKTKMLRQDDTTDTYSKDQVILTGWGFIIQGGSSPDVKETVTFGVTFASAPVVLISQIGRKAAPDPTDISEFIDVTVIKAAIADITTGGFDALIRDIDGNNLNSAWRYGYSWIAIGTL